MPSLAVRRARGFIRSTSTRLLWNQSRRWGQKSDQKWDFSSSQRKVFGCAAFWACCNIKWSWKLSVMIFGLSLPSVYYWTYSSDVLKLQLPWCILNIWFVLGFLQELGFSLASCSCNCTFPPAPARAAESWSTQQFHKVPLLWLCLRMFLLLKKNFDNFCKTSHLEKPKIAEQGNNCQWCKEYLCLSCSN